MFSVIRPYNYEFPRGEGKKKRELREYIPEEGTSHIIIEWILDSKKELKFLLTGMAVQRTGKELKQLFYASQYTNEIQIEDVTINNFPIFDEDENFLGVKDLRTKLKSKKATKKLKIDYTEKKGEWENFLKGNFIEPELYIIQAKMNQRESAQDTIMSFGNNIEFFERIVELIMPYEDSDDLNENLRAVQVQFNEIKQLPIYKEKLEFCNKLRGLFSSGVSLLERRKKLNKELEEKVCYWDGFINKIKTMEDVTTRLIKKLEKESKFLSKKMERTEKRLKSKKNMNKFVILNLLILSLENLKNNLSDLENKKKEIVDEKYVLDNLLEYRETVELQERIDDLETMIKETTSPLREKLEKHQKEYVFFCLNQFEKLEEQVKILKQGIKNLRDNLTYLKSEKVRKETELIYTKNEIENNHKKERDVKDMIIKFREEGYIKESETPIIALKRITGEILVQEEMIKTKEDFLDSILKEHHELELESIEQKKEKEQYAKEQQIIFLEISEMKKAWQALTESRYFKREYDPYLIGSKDPKYDCFSNEDMTNVVDLKSQYNSKKVALNLELKNKKELIKYVEDNGSFPAPLDINKILDLLKDKGINASYGWKYMLDNYSIADKEKVILLAKIYPYLLEGIVIIHPKKEEVYELLLKQDIFTQFPLYIFDTSFFLNEINEQTLPNSILIYNTIEWKYNSFKSQDYLSQIIYEVSNYHEQIKEINNSLQIVEEFYSLSNNFLIKYPEEQYLESNNRIDIIKNHVLNLEEKIKKLNFQIDKKQQEIKEDEDLISGIKHKLKNLTQIKESLIEIKKEWMSLQGTLEANKQLTDKRDSLSKEIETYENDLNNLDNDIRKNVDILDNLNHKLANLEFELKQIDIDYESIYQKFVKQNPYHELFTNNIDSLKQTYIQAKEDCESNSTIDMHQEELEKKRSKRNKIRDRISKRLKKRNLDFHKLVEFSRSQQHLGEDDVDNRGLELDKKKESIQEEISIINQYIESKNKEKEDTQDWFTTNNIAYVTPSDMNFNVIELELIQKKIENSISYIETNKESLQETIEFKLNRKEKYTKIIEKINNLLLTITPYKEILDDFQSKTGKDKIKMDMSQDNSSTLELDSFESQITIINSEIVFLTDFTTRFKHNFEDMQDRIGDFIRKVNSLSHLPEDSKIHRNSIVLFAATFEEKFIDNIEMFIKNLDAKILNFENKISEHDEKLENIVKVYKMKTEMVLSKVHELQRTRLKVPESNLDKKQVFNIDLELKLSKNEDKEFIKNQIKEYFIRLGRQERFPKRLDSYNQLIKDLVRECIKNKINKIKFLVPRPGDLKPEYRELVETLKASGGETATVAILLYCLIAHFRMKEIFSQNGKKIGRMIPSSTFIMDNPFGKANRNDLVEVQLALAEALNIQILAFSGHQDVNIIDQFDTVLPLRPYIDIDTQDTIVELDKQDINYKIKGDSITRLQKQTLESFMKES